jgi:hypothetical protein
MRGRLLRNALVGLKLRSECASAGERILALPSGHRLQAEDGRNSLGPAA